MPRKNIQLTHANRPFLERTENLLKYYGDVSKAEILPNEKIQSLLVEYQTAKNDRKIEIRDIIIHSHLRLVISMARSYSDITDNVLDLIQEGNIGLMIAIDTYDVTKPSCFNKWAIFYIRRQINQFKNCKKDTVRQSNKCKVYYSVQKISKAFLQKEGRYPTKEEIVDIYNQTHKHNPITFKDDVNTVSYFSIDSIDLTNESQEKGFDDYIKYSIATSSSNAGEKNVNNSDQHEFTEKLLGCLTDVERKVVKMRFGFDDNIEQTFNWIGDKLQMNPVRVGRIFKNAMTKMTNSEISAKYV